MVSVPTADGGHRWYPYRRAAAAGAAAFVAGYLATGVLLLIDGGPGGSPSVREATSGGLVEHLRGVGLVFLEAQFTTIRAEIGTHAGASDLLPGASATVPVAAYYLVPVLAIAAASYWFVAVAPFRPASAEISALVGAGVVLGYLPLAILGLGLFGTATVQIGLAPDPVTGFVYPGFVYPTAGGMLGGTLAWGRQADAP